MMGILCFWLICAAIFLELADRAPTLEEENDRRLRVNTSDLAEASRRRG
jgi:hypothetical protein